MLLIVWNEQKTLTSMVKGRRKFDIVLRTGASHAFRASKAYRTVSGLSCGISKPQVFVSPGDAKMTDFNPQDQFCSLSSAAYNEPLARTANHVVAWLLLEYPLA